jgi:hypothetical protein
MGQPPRKLGAFGGNNLLGNRAVERTQGCWNCRHFDRDKAKQVWQHRRQIDLQRALEGAQTLPGGEEHAQVRNIRLMVNTLDHAIVLGKTGMCAIQAVDTDFVNDAYLCVSWTGAIGASLARAGGEADKLPEELMADIKAEAEKA